MKVRYREMGRKGVEIVGVCEGVSFLRYIVCVAYACLFGKKKGHVCGSFFR